MQQLPVFFIFFEIKDLSGQPIQFFLYCIIQEQESQSGWQKGCPGLLLVRLGKVIKNWIVIFAAIFCFETLQQNTVETETFYTMQKELIMKTENQENMKRTETVCKTTIIAKEKTSTSKIITLKHF